MDSIPEIHIAEEMNKIVQMAISIEDVQKFKSVDGMNVELALKANGFFGAYNAVTGYFQNVRNFGFQEHKLKSMMYGTGFQRAQTTFDLCQKIGEKGILVLN